MAGLDMDYCMIVIDKIINPLTPKDQIGNLVKHALEMVQNEPGMKSLVLKIMDPRQSAEQKRVLKEQLRSMGGSGPAAVDYESLIDKFVDPKLPDSEYKPTMMALLHGDLEQERKNVVQSIISCKDPEKKVSLVKKFKNFWAKEREEKAARERELAELAEQRRAKKAAEDLKNDIPENILEFSDDGMTLINRLINKKIDQEKRTQIYDRLMEPDVDADVKNLALQLISITKFTLMKERVEQFIKEREEAVVAAERRKEEAAKRKEKQEKDAEDRKNWAWNMKQKLAETKEKNERLMKRDLMLKMRAKQRKGEKAMESSGHKLSQEEKQAMRAKEMEKMKEEMRMYKEKQRQEMLRKEEEARLRAGWMVTEFDEEVHTKLEADVVVCDLNNSLVGEHLEKFKKAMEVLKEKVAAAEKELKEQEEREKEAREAKLRILKEEAEKKRLAEKPKIEDKEPNFDENFEKLSKPEITDVEEKAHFTGLIKDKRSALVRQLIIEMNVKGIQGKSPIFKALSKKFADDIAKRKEIDGGSLGAVASKSESDKTKESEDDKKRKLDSGAEIGKEPKKVKEGGDEKEAERKRKASGDSIESKEAKKGKSEGSGDGDKSKLLIGALVPKSSDVDDKKQDSKHREEKKHKKDKDREKDREREREREKSKKKDKDRDREREKEKESDRDKHKKSKKEKHHKHDKDREESKAKKVGSEVRSSIDEASNISSASTERDRSVEPNSQKAGPASMKKSKAGPASSKKPQEAASRDASRSPVRFSRSPSRSLSRSPIRFVSRTPSPS